MLGCKNHEVFAKFTGSAACCKIYTILTQKMHESFTGMLVFTFQYKKSPFHPKVFPAPRSIILNFLTCGNDVHQLCHICPYQFSHILSSGIVYSVLVTANTVHIIIGILSLSRVKTSINRMFSNKNDIVICIPEGKPAVSSLVVKSFLILS